MRIIILVLFTLLISNSHAKELKDLFNGNLNNLTPKNGVEIKLDNFLVEFKSALNLEKGYDFIKIKELKDKFGYNHLVYQQHYNGIKIEGAIYHIHSKNGIFVRGNGIIYNNYIFAVSDTIGINMAIAKVVDSIPIYTKDYETIIKNLISNNINITPSIYPIFNEKKKDNYELKYCYKIGVDNPINKYYYVDANNGKIISSSPSILQCGPGIFGADEGCNENSTANTVRYGQKRVVTCYDDNLSEYHLHDCKRNFTTINSNYSYTTDDYTNFLDLDNVWNNNGEMENEFMDAYALDAHYCVESAFDLFKHYGIDGFDGNETHFNVIMHTTDLGDPTVLNAYWSLLNNQILLGDGDGSIFENFSTLDVIGHEYTHGIMHNAITLNTSYGEMGSIHEGLADIFGVLTAHSTNLDLDWKMGDEILPTGSTYSCIRNLETPNDPTSYNFGPDTYLGDLWATSGYHAKSLVLSHWFYLFVNGGSGTNDLGANYNITGTYDKFDAGEFLLNTLIFQGIGGNTMLDLKNSLIAQAIAEFGECTPFYKRLLESLYAVGLSSTANTNSVSIQNLTLPETSCNLSNNNNISFQINNLSCEDIPAGTIIPLIISINNTQQNVDYELIEPLAQNNLTTVTLGGFDFSLDGNYEITLTIASTFDNSTSDNSISGTVKNITEINSPMLFNFEDYNPDLGYPDPNDFFFIETNTISDGYITNESYEGENALRLGVTQNNSAQYNNFWSNYNSPDFYKSNIASINFCVNSGLSNLNVRTKILNKSTLFNQTSSVFINNNFSPPALNATDSELNTFRTEYINLSTFWGQSYDFSLKHKSSGTYSYLLLDNIEFYKQYENDIELIVTNIPQGEILNGNYPLNITLNNIGLQDISGVTVQVTINGTDFIVPINSNILASTELSIQNILDLIGISYTFEVGQEYNISINVLAPSDENLNNNEINFTLNVVDCVPYSGTYIVGIGGDFTSIQQAIDALVNCKINGNVELKIDGNSGVFHEQVLIPEIPTFDNNEYSVTLRGINDAKIENNSISADNYSVIKVSRAKNIFIKNLEINQTMAAEKGACVHITDSSKNVSIDECILENPNNGSQQTGLLIGEYNNIAFSLGWLCEDCNIKNSTITSRNIGVYLSGINNTGGKMSGVFNSTIVSSNIGVYSNSSIIPIIESSNITASSKVVFIEECYGSKIERNILKSSLAEDILYLKNTHGIAMPFFFFIIIITNEIYDNFIIFNSNGLPSKGVSLDNSDDIVLYNNSVSMVGGNNTKAFYSNYSAGARIFIRNNSFACFGSPNDLAFEAPFFYPSSIYFINNNNLYVKNGDNVCKINNIYYNSTNFQNNPQGYFAESISENPRYINNTQNLRIECTSPLIDRGEIPTPSQNFAYAGADIDLKERNAMRTDIGAFEYQHNGLKAYLEAAYLHRNRQHTTLHDLGLIPDQQPFFLPPYNLQESQNIGTTYDNIVDWVFLEARNMNNPCFVEDKTSALLLDNGYIVSPKNFCTIEFPNLEPGEYYFVVRHSNHQDIMTDTILKYPFVEEFDFTLSSNSACNSNLKFVDDRTYCMYAGDTKIGGEINTDDLDIVIEAIGTTNTYSIKDVNLDGQINDVDVELVNTNVSINPISCENTLLDENNSLCNPCSENYFDPTIIPFEVVVSKNSIDNFSTTFENIICDEDVLNVGIFPGNGDYNITSLDYINATGTGSSSDILNIGAFKYIRIVEAGNYNIHITNKYGCEIILPMLISSCREFCDNNFDDDFDGLVDCEDTECENSISCCLVEEVGPISCSSVLNPVCGCNGVTYQNECIASAFVKEFEYGICSPHLVETNWTNNIGVFCYITNSKSSLKKFDYNIFWDNKFSKYYSKTITSLTEKDCSSSKIAAFKSTVFLNKSNITFNSEIKKPNIKFSLQVAGKEDGVYKYAYNNVCIPCLDFTNSVKSSKILANEPNLSLHNEKLVTYPNPIKQNNALNIILPKLEYGTQLKINVNDILGRDLYNTTFNYNNEPIYKIDVKNYTGTLFITLQSSDGILYKSKILVIE
jgi:Zn-dependent metalloprotease